MAVVDDAPPRLTPRLSGRMAAGVAGGLAGGVVFGVVMQLGGSIPMVAQLVGRESWVAGWAVHMSIAAFVGLTFALIFGSFAVGLSVSTLLGSFYGLIWWVLGGLTLMPLRLGSGLFVFDSTAWESLVGHLAYGCALGALYAVVGHLWLGARRRRDAVPAPAASPADSAASSLGEPSPAAPGFGPSGFGPPGSAGPGLAAPSTAASGALPTPSPPPLAARSGLLGSPPVALPLERRTPPTSTGQPSILEFVLPPVDTDPAAPPAPAGPAGPAGPGTAPLPPSVPWAGWQQPDLTPDRATPPPDPGPPAPGRKPWEVRQHRG